MAYLFNPSAADVITVSGVTLWTTKCSVFARFKMTAANTDFREIVTWETAGANDWQMYLEFFDTGTNRIEFGYRDSGGTFRDIPWTTGFTAGTIHTVVGTIDTTLGSANIKLYADTDATEKASLTSTLGHATASTPVFRIGNHPDSPTLSAAATIYEIGYWATVAITGAQAAQLGGGDANGIPLPTHYWDLIVDPYDMFGGKNGVNSGAGLVAHAGRNLWPLASIWQPLYQRAPVLAQ